MDESVAAYRKIIVLMDNSSALDEGNRERVHTAAWIQFEQNRDRLEKVEEDLHADVVNTSSPLTDAFLTRLESNADYRDADKLVFRDLLDDLASIPSGENVSAPMRKRIADDVAVLEKIQTLYQKEITQVFAGLETRGMTVHREAWEHYVDFLKTKYNREQLLRESESQLPPAELLRHAELLPRPVRRTGMGDRALPRRAHEPRIFLQHTRQPLALPRHVGGAARRQLFC